jgi:hypothetical protein
MNNRKYLLILSLILSTFSADAFAHSNDSCGQIPALRAKLAVLPNVAWVGAKWLKAEITDLERACASERAHRDAFLSRLSGFQPVSFYQRMNALLAGFGPRGILPVNEALKDRFLDFADALDKKNLSFIFEPDNETRYAAFKLDLMTTANHFSLALLDALHIDMNEIYGVDALFSAIEQGLQSLRK